MASDWRDKAACAGMPQAPWFDCVDDPATGERRVDESELAQCRAICLRCPVRVPCFQSAMEAEGRSPEEFRFGVRAGTTPEQRASLYRRYAVSCIDCGEVYDPLASIDGLLVCECGEQRMWSVDDRGDKWLDRHTRLAQTVREWMEENAVMGAPVLSPTALARYLKARRDDVIRVYRALVRDGKLQEGEGRGVYIALR